MSRFTFPIILCEFQCARRQGQTPTPLRSEAKGNAESADGNEKSLFTGVQEPQHDDVQSLI